MLQLMERKMRRFKKISAAGFVVLILSICCVCETAFAEGHWVGTWACSQQPGSGQTVSGNTLRQVVHVSLGGSRVRVQFSNKYSSGAVTISSAHIAASAGTADGTRIIKATDTVLYFGGSPSVTISAGQEVYSDAADFNAAPLSNLTVSIYIGAAQSSNISGHLLSMATSYIRGGDVVSATGFAATTVNRWFILSGIDVWRDDSYACVTLGDSITDGAGSTTNGNNRWPDDFARRLQADPSTAKIGVLNQGISGNMVVSGGTGPTALARFDHDVLEASGVRWVIILEGVNDIGNSSDPPTTASNIIAAFEQLINKAHAQNILVYGAPILPFKGSMYDTPGKLAARLTVNNWIRTSGKFDAVIDMDAAICNPADTDKMLAVYDTGDHLHPSAAGLQKMADTIDLALFNVNAKPVADAGIDQTVYAWIDSIAEVNLDGSGSYDVDNDPLTYKWTWSIDGNTYDTNDVSPTINLPTGQHNIELVVNDGKEDSEPNDVNITVIGPIEGTLSVMPHTINLLNEQASAKIAAMLRLPPDINEDQIDNTQRLSLYPGETAALRQNIISYDVIDAERVWILALFDKSKFLNAAGTGGEIEVDVVGQLKTGQYFFGSDTVWVRKPARKPLLNGL